MIHYLSVVLCFNSFDANTVTGDTGSEMGQRMK